MPVLPGTRQPVTVQVSDRIIGDLRIKQVAVETGYHEYYQHGAFSNRLELLVTMYATDATGQDIPLTMPGFMPRVEHLVGNNDTLVDAATGAILAIRPEGMLSVDWAATCAAFEQETMLQGDYFEQLSQQVLPWALAAMKRHHIQQADRMGRFS